MTMKLITGLIGMALLIAFLGIMMWWIKALPIFVISLVAIALLAEDFIAELRSDASKG